MPSAIDASVLLAFTQRMHPKHAVARAAIRNLTLQGELLRILPQNVTEFWGVSTRPASARGGFGKTPTEADQQTRLLERLFVLLPDTPAIYHECHRLVVAHSVSGLQVQDARIAAALRVHGVTRLLTFNTSDSTRYPGVTAVDPANV